MCIYLIYYANELKLANVKYKEDEYLEDAEKVNILQEKYNKLENQISAFKDKYYNKTINNTRFGWYSEIFTQNKVTAYINELKKKSANFKKYPSKDDIEKEIILAGNKDIPALIETIINKLKK